MTNRVYPPTYTQCYILRAALANGGRYIARERGHVLMARRMCGRGWLEELPNPTEDGAVAFDITEAGMRALKESETNE